MLSLPIEYKFNFNEFVGSLDLSNDHPLSIYTKYTGSVFEFPIIEYKVRIIKLFMSFITSNNKLIRYLVPENKEKQVIPLIKVKIVTTKNIPVKSIDS